MFHIEQVSWLEDHYLDLAFSQHKLQWHLKIRFPSYSDRIAQDFHLIPSLLPEYSSLLTVTQFSILLSCFKIAYFAVFFNLKFIRKAQRN